MQLTFISQRHKVKSRCAKDKANTQCGQPEAEVLQPCWPSLSVCARSYVNVWFWRPEDNMSLLGHLLLLLLRVWSPLPGSGQWAGQWIPDICLVLPPPTQCWFIVPVSHTTTSSIYIFVFVFLNLCSEVGLTSSCLQFKHFTGCADSSSRALEISSTSDSNPFSRLRVAIQYQRGKIGEFVKYHS